MLFLFLLQFKPVSLSNWELRREWLRDFVSTGYICTVLQKLGEWSQVSNSDYCSSVQDLLILMWDRSGLQILSMALPAFLLTAACFIFSFLMSEWPAFAMRRDSLTSRMGSEFSCVMMKALVISGWFWGMGWSWESITGFHVANLSFGWIHLFLCSWIWVRNSVLVWPMHFLPQLQLV